PDREGRARSFPDSSGGRGPALALLQPRDPTERERPMDPSDDLSPRLRKALANPIGDRQAWSDRLTGVLIASYLWVAYPDTLATTLAVGGLPAAIGGAALGGLLACVLLFLPAAMQGLRTRLPLMVVATSAFGVR